MFRNPNLVNGILYFAGWWGAVLSLSQGKHQLTIAVLGALIVANFALVERGSIRALKVSLILGFIGYAVDLIGVALGLFSFVNDSFVFWLLLLWILFASTFSRSMKFFGQKVWIAALSGGIAGPLTYYAAQRFGVLNFNEPFLFSYIAYTAIWAILFPLLYWVNRRIDT